VRELRAWARPPTGHALVSYKTEMSNCVLMNNTLGDLATNTLQ
jgi:hypothetical protein